MHAGLADHVVDEGHVVGAGSEWGDRIAEHAAAFAIRFEVPYGFLPRAESVLEGFDFFAEVGVFAVMFDQLRFVVEEINVAGGSAHEELDDALGFWLHDLGWMRGLCCAEGGKGEAAEALAGGLEELASGKHDQSTKVNSFRFKITRQVFSRPSFWA